ncbi:hypothetical protein [Candidatus Absconditicoccus praedator]|uniref:hypothetical protein n=1 Tax=Candidatus Absconditicoccus praedator TaxID=2735562 RepID=UPI001E39351E|nr:hypothetical protein [Candidatus Absconditicoccus praedator]UFX82649.1 hypothetical protein HLG78_00660 [Candidatus Absconditicoccus praedator]
MKNTYFNNVVKKILKSKNKIVSTQKIKKIVQNILDTNYNDSKAYKIIYYLKNRGYIVSIKKNIFFVKDPNTEITEEDLIEKYYWDILKNHCKENFDKDRYIGGIKALQLNINDFSIPEEIQIINPNKQAKEVVLSGKYVNFKKYKTGKENIFKKLKKHTNKTKIGKNVFQYSCIELALLESLYSPDIIVEKYNQELTKKILKKYKKIIDYKVIEKIIDLGKYHTSINRLYKISMSIDPKLGENFANVIKKKSFFLELN